MDLTLHAPRGERTKESRFAACWCCHPKAVFGEEMPAAVTVQQLLTSGRRPACPAQALLSSI